MNIIKQGDPKKDIKTFRCPLCGCEWEASFKNKEFRWITVMVLERRLLFETNVV